MQLDIAFLIDASNSVGTHFKTEKEFIKSIIHHTGLSREGVHAGVITFSYSTTLNMQLDTTYDMGVFNATLNGIPLEGSQTMINKALELAGSKMFTKDKIADVKGDRKGVPDMIVLITDGSQTPGGRDPVDVGKELRARGISVLVVGIGFQTYKPELDDIAGDPSNVEVIDDYEDLTNNKVIDGLAKKICEKRK